MLNLYIVRHGETEWNTEKRMQGWLDSPLTENGKASALLLGEKLKDVKLDAIYSSTSGRASVTAELIRGERQLPLYLDDLLREMRLGDWEGETHRSIEENYASDFHAYWHTPHLFRCTGSETFSETKERAEEMLEKIKEKHPSGSILIVTHAVIIKCLYAIFRNLPVAGIWEPPFIHNTSLTQVEMNDSGCRILLEGEVLRQPEIPAAEI
ncbi:histidine phosphatase family protein [Peribacillus sp. SCS-37]|uniref:histidine phosphatase family protein n=1 Tax=Paraperibacillus esterisolvens TaxID=3115296 RepID=UPI0039058B31